MEEIKLAEQHLQDLAATMNMTLAQTVEFMQDNIWDFTRADRVALGIYLYKEELLTN